MRLFSNAVVRPFSEPASPADAVLVDGEKILAVGERAELLEIAGARVAAHSNSATASAKVEEVDCGGRVLLPGLVDAHMHSVAYADSLTDLDLSAVSSLAEAVAAIRDRAHTIPAGDWVLGSGWDSNTWDEPQQPDRVLLDRAVQHHPVAMWSVDMHTLWVNARALEIAGIDARTPNPAGGEFDRDLDGELTGILREEAAEVVARLIPEPSEDAQVERLRTTQKLFLSQGLTGIHDFDGAASTRGWSAMRARGLQDIRVMQYLRGAEVPWAVGTGWRTGDGDDWLLKGGLKLFSDGALGSHTCHMSSPFPDPQVSDSHPPVGTADQPANYGIAQMSEGELFEQAKTATEAGISVAIHAIGDQANHHVLDVFERLRPITKAAEVRFDRPFRHRIEHAQFVQPGDVPRLRELEIIASMQPRHCISDLHLLHLIDESAQLAAYAWSDLLHAGARLAFGSDGPVEPANPFAAIYATMTRANISGDPRTSFQPERRMSAAEALRQHTLGPAYAAGLEGRRGDLVPGMDADFTIVDVDPWTADGLREGSGTTQGAGAARTEGDTTRTAGGRARTPDGLLGYASEQALFAHAEAIRDTQVAMTVVGGQVKHST